MQHHGLPTRLLDWTESALVGLYFAVERGHQESPGAVWLLNPWQLNASLAKTGYLLTANDYSPVQKYLWPVWKKRGRRLRDGPITFEPPHNSKRLAAQRGKFTIHGKSRRGIDTFPSLSSGLAKIVIPAGAKDKLRRQLATAGITEGVIFPDLSGLSREIKEAWSYAMDLE